MIDLTKLSEEILTSLRERSFTDEEISKMEPRAIWDEYCIYYGVRYRWLFDIVMEIANAHSTDGG